MRAIRRRDFNYDVTRTYNTMVNAGEDIGTTEYLIKPDGTLSSPAVGTLGCWVQIKKKGEDWETMALTNYHVVRPALKGFRLKKEGESLLPSIPDGESPCWKGDKNGLWPKRLANRDNRNEPTTDIEHPARAKHNFSVTELLEEIKTRPTSARQNRLSDWIAFFDQDKHLLGNIWLASGYKHRTKPESRSDGEPTGRLDWALIQPVDTCRIGVNKLPTETNWDSKYSIGNAPDPVTFGNTLKSQGVSLHDFVQGGNVYKVGASTKWTAGEFSNFKTNCSVAEDGYLGMGKSGEYVVIGKVNNDESSIPFANKGDSGSVVWGQDGRVLGLLFEGQQPQSNDDGYSFVTPIEDVFDHIKGFGMLELGGAVVEDIRLA
ncbi:hypothetical protein B0T25DRAFT_540358 [Lasiosphaeria hispida]|uniref:Peptidase S1 domain-containing protein n=1 Tax=Lasiosphaeria hispida TaxID=260671 RepID=A0AAJ0HMX8_9PEZI|nr:hypothetical protein B0T25DRAFT_540358 [Lasiosphaeria hispida]